MADDPIFFRARAEQERAAGDAATLDNVRDRCRRAQAAWEAMAIRAERTRTMRANREAGISAALTAPAGYSDAEGAH